MKTEFTIPENLPFDLSASFRAARYQRWIMNFLRPKLGRRVLELGAGCGSMSQHFGDAERLALVEPDESLRAVLERGRQAWFPEPGRVSLHGLSLPQDSLEPFYGEAIDTVVSFNVLEHIEDDLGVLKALAELLRRSEAPGPRRLITFVPAHPFAYGSLDGIEGHFRRYSRAAFAALAAEAAPDAAYSAHSFNFFGLWGWWLSGRVLKKQAVDHSTIATFEALLPFLKPFDTLLMRGLRLPLGQSLVTVLEWPARKS
jgi:SAM-dependent methyltransferase